MINKSSSILSIIITLGLLSLLLGQLPKVEFDYELENFFSKEDPDLVYHQAFSEKFGNDNDYILVGLKAEGGLFNPHFLNKVDSLRRDINKLTATQKTISLSNINKLIKSPMGIIEIPYVHLSNPNKLSQDSVKLYAEPHIKNFFISKDEKRIKLAIVHQRFNSKTESDEYINQIETLLNKSGFLDYKLVGKSIGQKAFVNAVEEDFSKFILIALGLIFLLLLIFMRSLPMILVSLAISGLSVGATIGLMVLMGKKIDVLSTLIPSILLVVSMSDLIHLYSQIQREYQGKGNYIISLNKAVKKIGMATFLTSFTTAIGFLTLITIHVQPIVDLGIYAATGIVIAFLITYLLFPPLIFLLKPKLKEHAPNQWIKRLSVKIFLYSIRNTKQIYAYSAIILLLVIGGISMLKIDAYLADELPQGNKAREDFLYFDKEFAGSRPFSLSIWLKDSSQEIYSKDVIQQINLMENLAKNHIHVGDLISPVNYVKAANQAIYKGSANQYKLPTSDKDWQKTFRLINQIKPERRLKKVTDGIEAQLTGYFPDLGSKDATQKNEKFLKDMSEQIDLNLLGYRITGSTLLIDKSHQYLSINLLKGLLFAMLIVGSIAGWMFKSFRMAWITLIPNLLPILITAGVMGYFDIPINLSTSVIFAISFGIVVDDTIHFLSKFKSEYVVGTSKLYAIKRTLISAGEPIITTTILLTTGFSVFCFSQFGATFYTGLFVSISFIVALLADLFLLPVLILSFMPEKKSE